jgi:hypothetical protein
MCSENLKRIPQKDGKLLAKRLAIKKRIGLDLSLDDVAKLMTSYQTGVLDQILSEVPLTPSETER